MIGVLAVQGAFREHREMLAMLGEGSFEIRNAADLDRGMDGLILPGGESTVMGKLMDDLGMTEGIRGMISDGLPVLGTCAGMILLAERIVNDDRAHLSTMPISVRRNAYGRQLGSFSAVGGFGDMDDVPMEFIRAPWIESVGDGVDILSEIDGHTVAARFGNQVATAFHPELTGDTRVHRYFLDIVGQ